MNDGCDDWEQRARATWLRASRELDGSITALEFGDTVSGAATGDASAAPRLLRLPLGVGALARRYLLAPRPGESAIEAAIAEAEEAIMPLRPLLPTGSRCVSADPRVAWIAEVLGLAPAPWLALDTQAVEHGFNRWVSIALGRPATQDSLPASAEFGASLLVLREWLHHLGFPRILSARPGAGP